MGKLPDGRSYFMKFAVYEVREDEKKMLNTLAERHHLELALTAGSYGYS